MDTDIHILSEVFPADICGKYSIILNQCRTEILKLWEFEYVTRNWMNPNDSVVFHSEKASFPRHVLRWKQQMQTTYPSSNCFIKKSEQHQCLNLDFSPSLVRRFYLLSSMAFITDCAIDYFRLPQTAVGLWTQWPWTSVGDLQSNDEVTSPCVA